MWISTSHAFVDLFSNVKILSSPSFRVGSKVDFCHVKTNAIRPSYNFFLPQTDIFDGAGILKNTNHNENNNTKMF